MATTVTPEQVAKVIHFAPMLGSTTFAYRLLARYHSEICLPNAAYSSNSNNGVALIATTPATP